MSDVRTTGTVQPEADITETSDDAAVEAAREGFGRLLSVKENAVAKHVEKRWKRLDKVARKRLTELKVNYLRYEGQAFVQVHPSDSNRIFIPPGASSKRAPTINKIKRSVQRYVAQITADRPVMEGVPASHRDEDRDSAESATLGLRGEWQRMGLDRELRRVATLAAVMRSGFWFFQFDKMAGGQQKAQKYFSLENGEKVLEYVDRKGNRVADGAAAADISVGDITVDVMSPANVRWSGNRYAHKATEVMVAEIMTLGDLYEMDPSTREVKIEELVTGDYRPMDDSEWLQDLRGESERGLKRTVSKDVLGQRGSDLNDDDSVLDEPVRVTHYFKKKGRQYKKGFHAITAGNHLVHRGTLRYGLIPVGHFKLLDEIADPMGLGLVDLLKDPQELLDFVNGQILRYLQMLKRRWFVPMHSGVKSRDLNSPTRSIIEYNPQAGAPTPEQQPEIPNSLTDWVDRFDREYDDQLGIHDTMQGKHVPGVSSGRHAEALRSGDETLLALSRDQFIEGLEASAEIILAMMQKEWTIERRVRFMGDDRDYVERAFSATHFGQTNRVIMKNSTLLMLTPAQRLESIMVLAEAGHLGADEVRQLAPLGDVAGISLTEDVHYMRARRQNSRFLAGPPKRLLTARARYESDIRGWASQQEDLMRLQALGGDPTAVKVAAVALEDGMAVTEAEWAEELDLVAWDHREWEENPDISRIHAKAHATALAHHKAERFPDWWVTVFEEHATMEWVIGYPEQQLQKAEVDAAVNPPPPPPPPGPTPVTVVPPQPAA